MSVEWFGEKILEQVNSVAAKVSKDIAEDVMRDAKTNLKRNSTTTTKGLLSQFYIEKSKFKNGGYIVWCQGPKKWRKPYHAAFLEVLGAWVHPYGNKKIGKVYLPPKPFMRPAVSKNRRPARRLYQEGMDKV